MMSTPTKTSSDESTSDETCNDKILKEDSMRNDTQELQKESRENEIVDTKIQSFIAHIPSLGGYFYKNNGKRILVSNTCTIDNYLFALWVLSKLMPNFNIDIAKFEYASTLIDIIQNIDVYNWDNARQLWYTRVMKKNIRNKNHLSFFGTVEDYVLKFFYNYQNHDLVQKCTIGCLLNGNTIISENSYILYFGKIRNIGVDIVTDSLHKCSRCKMRTTCYVRFKNSPILIFLETMSHFKYKELPKTFEFDNKNYQLLCVIFHRPDIEHFVSVFEIENNQYLVDNMVKNKAPLLKSNNECGINYFDFNISSALYYLL